MNTKIRTKIISSMLLCTTCMYSAPVLAFTKDETVYSKMNTKGENYQTIVSTHIENNDELELINDISDLLNIENTNGEEEFTQERNSLVWKADKKDIYYQGESQKDLPIECNIKYELEGKEISAEEIAGKTGSIKITLQYYNKDEHIVTINGQSQKMYTPFVVIAGTVLKNDKNQNIQISNGKIINDGSKSFALGMVSPGLQESLNINTTDIQIPNNIELTMDATDFELGNIVTFVTPKVLEDTDLTFLDKLDEISHKVNTLEQASKQIQEGSTTLEEGTNQLASGAKELNNGTSTAYNGAKQIKSEVTKATNQLANDKSETLDENTLNMIGEQAKQSATLSDAQKAQIGSQAQSVAIQNIQSQKAAIGEKAASQVSNLILTAEQKQQIANNVKLGLEANSSYQALSANEQAIVLQFSQSSAISASETTAKQTAKQVANVTAQSVAEEVASTVANTTAQFVAQSTAIQTAQTTSTIVAKQVANEVKSQAQKQVFTQMSTLTEGLEQLTNGLGNLKDGSNSLQNGVNQLNKGASTLSDGIKTFHEDGIKKICDYLNSDIKDVNERIEKLVELSKKYDNFTMLNNENKGAVKFIMIMDAIKKQEADDVRKEQAILPTQKNHNKESK